MRWQQWRLLWNKKAKVWLLFDLHADPEEKTDLAAKHPEVLETLQAKHQAFTATLPSLDSIPPYKRGSQHRTPEGWGWVIGDGKAQE